MGGFLDIPEHIKCPNCSNLIETTRICSLCNAKNQALINLYPEIFQETVFDRLNPKLDEIIFELNSMKKSLKDLKIKGLKLK